jgi:flagellar biosynthesis protein FliQ
MIFRSHLFSTIVFALIVSILMALIRYPEKKNFLRYAGKLFLYMVAGVIIFSWIMRFI